MGTRIRQQNLNTIAPRNEHHRLCKTVFKRADLLDSSILALEHSTYLNGGRSPVHAEWDSEEVIYIRRGVGQILVEDEYVDVRPGDAIAIPRGIEHHVVNPNEDALEHVLISADIGEVPLEGTYVPPAVFGEHLVGEGSALERLSCSRFVLASGEESKRQEYPEHEVMYALSSGLGVAHVQLPESEYEWQYLVDGSTCMWIPPKRPHYLRNTGDCDMVVVAFHCRSGADTSAAVEA